jgi:hypothetical protein
LLGLSHVVLHLAFCNAISRAPSSARVAMRVGVYDRIGRPQIQRTVRFVRGEYTEAPVEFDLSQGVYRLQVSVPAYDCNAIDYLGLIADHTRNVNEQLVDGAAPQPHPMLLEGTAPQSFLYVHPTFVLFNKSTQCNTPVGDQLNARTVIENDEDAYYVWLYSNPQIDALGSVTLALRLATSTGEYHYVRVKLPFPRPWLGWPQDVRLDVPEGWLDVLAGQPVDTLLCPRLFETSAG